MRKTTSLAPVCAIALGALSLTSCIVSESSLDNNPGVKFTAGIKGTPVLKTRTTDGGDSWVVGDGVGIYMINNGGSIPNYVLANMGNKRYNVISTQGELSPDEETTPVIDYPESGASVDFVAYYPYADPSECKIDENGLYNVSLTDQSAPEEIDVLIAKTSKMTSGPVNFLFNHALSKITLNLKLADDETTITAADVAAISDVQLSATPGSVDIDLNTGATTEGPTAAIPMFKWDTATTGYDATFSAIVAPTHNDDDHYDSCIGRYISVVLKGKTILWLLPSDDIYESGQNYVYWAELTETGFRVKKTDITKWNDNDKGPVTETIPAKIQGNYRINWTGNKYVLTADPANAGLYFKFGSVVGIYSGAGEVHILPTSYANINKDTFEAATDIAWDPTGTVSGDAREGWATVPKYNNNGTDYSKKLTITSESGYHSIENVKAGKGDPCRLVYLDLEKIKNTAANELTYADIDNGKWRLPTHAENQSFAGREVDGNFTGHWTKQDGINGGMFPDTTLGDETTFLPAAGCRDNVDGQVHGQISTAGYWSSTPNNATTGICFFHSATYISILCLHDFAMGHPVRCVRQ
jgi:hypothetical protein